MSLLLLFTGGAGGAPPPSTAKVSRVTIGIGIRIGALVLLLLGCR